MRIDIIDIFRFQIRTFQCIPHRQHGCFSVRIGRGNVIGICRHADTDDLGVAADDSPGKLGFLMSSHILGRATIVARGEIPAD